MRIAVVGAGIVGVTAAFELARDGHEVAVFERGPAVATGASFANAGVVAPGYVTPWAAPGMPGKVLRHLLRRHAPVRWGGMPDAATLRWLWQWWTQCRAERYEVNRSRMYRLARYSRDRLHALTEELGLDYEQARGYLVLLRTPREVELAGPGLSLLRSLGVRHHLLDRDACAHVEPGLNRDTPLASGIHLPDDGVGNCRQFAHRLKQQSQRLGVRWHFGCEALEVRPAAHPELVVRRSVDGAWGAPQTVQVDAIVIAAALGARALLARHGLRLPMVAVHGYSLTAPLRNLEGHPEVGPRAALMDETYKVAISRLGQRVRVAGSAEIGGSVERERPAAIDTLFKVLDDWFPGAVQWTQAQRWKGARPMLPDGPPLVGASGLPGVWLDLGHGSSGWALSCGSARLLADQIGGRACDIDPAAYALERWQRRRSARDVVTTA